MLVRTSVALLAIAGPGGGKEEGGGTKQREKGAKVERPSGAQDNGPATCTRRDGRVDKALFKATPS